MKTIKKIIILLFITMGTLIVGMQNVEASMTSYGSGSKIRGSALKPNVTYRISMNDYDRYGNLHCAEPGQHLSHWNEERYKLIAHAHIEGDTAYLVNLSTNNKRKNTAVTGKYNLRMATAICTLSDANVGNFLWGYLKLWIGSASSANSSYSILSGFATKNVTSWKNPRYPSILASVDKKMESMTVEKVEKLKVDTSNYKYKSVTIDDEEYVQIGPFKLNGIPSTGIDKLNVYNQDDKKMGSAKIITHTADGKIKEIKGSEIKENKNFYIAIPKKKNISSFNVKITTNKVNSMMPVADIYFLKCVSNISWQNLVVTEGKLQEKPSGEPFSVDFSIKFPGDLTIIKQDANGGTPLAGAKFAIFKYVKDDSGTWYKEGDSYTTNADKATDKTTKYKRVYVHKTKSSYTYEKVGFEKTVKGDSSYHFKTKENGKIELTNLEPGTYFAVELEAPEGYKKIDGFFKLGAVKASEKKEAYVDNEPDTTTVDIIKVNANNEEVVLEGVGFKFYSEENGWLIEVKSGEYKYTENQNEATLFKTDSNGKIHLENVRVGEWKYYEDSTTLPYGYDIVGKEEGSFKLESKDLNEVTIKNIQRYVKLSGFVWVDKVGVKSGDGNDRNDLFKTNQDGKHPDENDLLYDGMTVKLKEKSTGATVKETLTGKMDRYTDYGHNGHGEYLFQDVQIEKLEDYYIEFTYDGLNYTNVIPHIDQSSGSKAAESVKDRTDFNNKFSVIEGKTKDTGVAKGIDGNETELKYTIDEKERTATLNNDGKYTETETDIFENSVGQFTITANTNETGYSIKDNFVYGQEEIRYINLGLKDRDRPDITLGKDIQNVKVSVNGYDHTYQYAQRYASGATEYDGEGFNVGVKFKNNYTGTYTRAIYKSDYEYDPGKADKELKVYITYQLKMAQSNINLKAQVNSITDYFDSKYSIEKIGTSLNDDSSVGGTIIAERKDRSINRKDYR